MTIAGIILYAVFGFLTGPLWPLDVLSGKAGYVGYLMLAAVVGLLIGGAS